MVSEKVIAQKDDVDKKAFEQIAPNAPEEVSQAYPGQCSCPVPDRRIRCCPLRGVCLLYPAWHIASRWERVNRAQDMGDNRQGGGIVNIYSAAVVLGFHLLNKWEFKLPYQSHTMAKQ